MPSAAPRSPSDHTSRARVQACARPARSAAAAATDHKTLKSPSRRRAPLPVRQAPAVPLAARPRRRAVPPQGCRCPRSRGRPAPSRAGYTSDTSCKDGLPASQAAPASRGCRRSALRGRLPADPAPARTGQRAGQRRCWSGWCGAPFRQAGSAAGCRAGGSDPPPCSERQSSASSPLRIPAAARGRSAPARCGVCAAGRADMPQPD